MEPMDTANGTRSSLTRSLGRQGAALIVSAIVLTLLTIVAVALVVDAFSASADVIVVAPLRW
jgi:hypothetical protein